MNRSRQPFYFLIFILVSLGIGLSVHRHYAFNVPWLPGERLEIWSIESKIDFVGDGGAVKVTLALPDTQEGFVRVEEHTASAGFGLTFIEEPSGRKAQWTIRNASGMQHLYYRVDMIKDAKQKQEGTFTKPEISLLAPGSGPYDIAAQALLEQAVKRSADPYSLAYELVREFNNQAQNAEFITQDKSRITWLVELLQLSGIPAREVLGLMLEDGRRRQKLVSYLQVFDGDKYRIVNPQSGKTEKSEQMFLWEANSQPLIDVMGGSQTSVSFSMIKQDAPLTKLSVDRMTRDESLLDFSIHSLPLEEQALFKSILLIPVGVLIVVFLRIFVGLRTSGTFMPVLIAIAFVQTSLMTGLIGFFLIIGTGLIIRSYLSRLNLLLIARISTVIISIIILIAALSVIAYQLGLSEGLKITFFPMVILSWTVERMSILWEEEGPQEVLIQGGGSLLVAIITYTLLMNGVVRHLTFNFIGLQLVFMACVLLMGNYTGYRIMELRRFQPFLTNSKAAASAASSANSTPNSTKET